MSDKPRPHSASVAGLFPTPVLTVLLAFAPVFEKAAEAHADVVFGKVNTDEQQELAGAFNIRSIPTLMVFREKVILYSEPGALPPPALEEVITKTRDLDMAAVHKEFAEQREGGEPGPQT